MSPSVSTAAPTQILPLTNEEEEKIIHARITNDERTLKRIVSKFHAYMTLARDPVTLDKASQENKLKDARDSFLSELDNYELGSRKTSLACEAEARQVSEYDQERLRIDDEYGALEVQIDQLKTTLEHAQKERERKLEYDHLAERINTFPTREDLGRTIESLEQDMSLIKAEHEIQDRTMRSQKTALDNIVTEISQLRFIGKDQDEPSSTPGTPTPEAEDALDDDRGSGIPHVDDVEMGEVDETVTRSPGKTKKKSRDEELEEGEATDSSSSLSDPPDD